MKKNAPRNSISSLAPLLLFVIFTTCILSVLLTGANTYETILVRDQNAFDHRTTIQYLTTRVRQNDEAGRIFVGDFHALPSKDPLHDSQSVSPQVSASGDTLFLRETLDGRTFYTRIYCHNSYLMELFAEEGLDFAPSDGEKILEVQKLSFSLEGNLLSIEITYGDSSTEQLHLHLRTGKEDLS